MSGRFQYTDKVVTGYLDADGNFQESGGSGGVKGNSYPRIATLQATTNILTLAGLPYSTVAANIVIWNGFPAGMRYFEMEMKPSGNLPFADIAFVVVNATNDAAALSDLSFADVTLNETGAADNGALWVTEDRMLQVDTVSQGVDIESIHIMPITLLASGQVDDVILMGRGVVPS